MKNWTNINIPTFKETYGSYDDYLLGILNTSGKIEKSDFDVKKVSGGFGSSDVFFLKNTWCTKFIATAFHIPDKEKKIHHFNIHLVKFSRSKKSEQWKKIDISDIRAEEVAHLQNFIMQQNKLVGKALSKTYYRIISTDSPVTFSDLDLAINLILKNREVDFKSLGSEESKNLLSLIDKILEGKNILLEKGLYKQLASAKTNTKSLKTYKKDLNDFRDLIDKDDSSETDAQNFLENKLWFFGLNYIQSHRGSIPKFQSSLNKEYDFLLEGFNQVYDIAELKGPNDLLFEREKVQHRKRSTTDRVDYKFSSQFSRALHQVMCYMDEFEESFKQIKTDQPKIKDFMYPKGTIVLSKRGLFPKDGRNSIKHLHLINRQFSNIDILTYDDLADRGQILIDFLEQMKNKNE